MYKIIISPLAMEDLENINNYISNDNPLVAQKVIAKIFDTISNISIFPNIWKKLEWEIREIVEPNYKFRIIYKIKNEQIEIEIISIFKNKNSF